MLNTIFLLSNRFKSFLGLGALLLVITVFALLFGAYPLGVNEVFSSLFNSSNSTEVQRFLIWDVRLPRVFLAILVGGGLSVSGAVLQGLFRNPLASPSLIGVTSGAMLAAVIGIVILNRSVIQVPEWLGLGFMFALAIFGGWAVTFLVYRISTRKAYTSIASMLLAGVAISALAGAVTGLFTYFSNEEELRNITFWTLGSLASANWKNVLFLALVISVSILLLLRFSTSLDILGLGEQEAYYMGVNIQSVKKKVVILAAFIVGPCVAITGVIGFVALVIPHLMRSLGLGANHKMLITSSALGGAVLLVLADTFARTAIAPSELPIGILTAIIGGPYFLWLLIKNQPKL